MQTDKKQFFLRNVLMSTGEFTFEAVIDYDSNEFYESSPQGLTLGQNEASILTKDKEQDENILNDDSVLNFSQSDFDNKIASKFTSQISTALSLVFSRFLAYRSGYHSKNLYKYFSKTYEEETKMPTPIFNILNGGKHAGNELEFCEYMIIPKGVSIDENIKIASEIYADLKEILEQELGKKHTLVGREGGFAPDISDIQLAVSFVHRAIEKRNKNKCSIAIDVAANNFCEILDNGSFLYTIGNKKLSSNELIKYYKALIAKYPEICYLEDLFHEEDISAWAEAKNSLGTKILIVGDDLTVTNIKYLTRYKDCINACILKINQVGTLSELLEAYKFCRENNIKTIISQRSGETDSNIISHLAVGLGSNYIKSGAPARERIIKYNELLRISERF